MDFDLTAFTPKVVSKGETAEKIIISEVRDFEKLLGAEEELEIRANGSAFIITGIRSRGEYVIFEGAAENGGLCRLLVNIHQLNFSLRAVPKFGAVSRRIGFEPAVAAD